MFIRARLMATAVLTAFSLSTATPIWAETPADTFIQAWTLDDMISLDPAEVFEFSASEIIGNSYEPIIGYDIKDVSKIFGVVADTWTMSADGKTMSFTIKQGKKFASGNDMMADDVEFSITRAIKLDKSPAFILGQFGLTADNVDAMVKQTGDYSFDFTMDQAYAPTFLLYCLTATVAMVVDKDLVMANEVDGDFGYNWLKTNYAGSGAFVIREWRANESVVLERNDMYGGDKPAMARSIYRHIPEAATQRLLLEKGDIDLARDLLPEEIAALSANPDVRIETGVKGTIFYMALNQKTEFLAKPEVREAMKYLVDYQAIADTIVKGKMDVHQTFLPKGFLGELDSNPYSLNVEKAKELLAAAGLPDGFTVTMDTRNTPDVTAIAQAVQQTMALAGVTLEIIPGDGGQTLEKYRARTHDIYIGNWGPDYQDPHTNATFARNPDNSDEPASKPLAWRVAWDIPEMTAKADGAVLEADAEKRAATYRELQEEHQKTSPFIIMFQESDVFAFRSNAKGYVIGPDFKDNSFRGVTKE